MKIGAEDKKKVKVMAVLVAVAVLIIGYNFLSGPSTPAGHATGQPAATNADQTKKISASVSSLDPSVRVDILRMSQNVTYSGSGRNIFRMEAAAPTTIPGFD